MKKFIICVLWLLIPLACFAQELKLDNETKQICNQVMKQIYEDILKIKNQYKELENFNESALTDGDSNGELKGIYYSNDVIALRKDKNSEFGDNPFIFYVYVEPINAQMQAVSAFEYLSYSNLGIKLYGGFLNPNNKISPREIHKIVEKNAELLSVLNQQRTPEYSEKSSLPKALNKTMAKEIAEKYIAKQHYKDAYENKAHEVVENQDYFDVFLHRKNRSVEKLKGEGLVRIDKKTGIASWVPGM